MRLDARIMLLTLRAMTQGDGRRPANYFTGSAPNAERATRDAPDAAGPGATPTDPDLAPPASDDARS
jgi:hypothetical protein